jgi:hypothetical protein
MMFDPRTATKTFEFRARSYPGPSTLLNVYRDVQFSGPVASSSVVVAFGNVTGVSVDVTIRPETTGTGGSVIVGCG